MTERSVHVNKKIYACFVDFQKAFDRINHEKLMRIMEKASIPIHERKLIRHLYWNQYAVIRTKDGQSRRMCIRRGVRQRCIISPVLFNLYSEYMMKEFHDEVKGIVIGGRISTICVMLTMLYTSVVAKLNYRKLLQDLPYITTFTRIQRRQYTTDIGRETWSPACTGSPQTNVVGWYQELDQPGNAWSNQESCRAHNLEDDSWWWWWCAWNCTSPVRGYFFALYTSTRTDWQVSTCIMFSRCPFVRPSVRSSHLTYRHILKINEQILMSIDTSGRCDKDMKRSTLWSVA